VSRSAEQIRAEMAAETARIDAAYWSFCRCARAKPPSLVVPDAYLRLSELRDELQAAQRGEAAAS
jgi:hypothetical protein